MRFGFFRACAFRAKHPECYGFFWQCKRYIKKPPVFLDLGFCQCKWAYVLYPLSATHFVFLQPEVTHALSMTKSTSTALETTQVKYKFISQITSISSKRSWKHQNPHVYSFKVVTHILTCYLQDCLHTNLKRADVRQPLISISYFFPGKWQVVS